MGQNGLDGGVLEVGRVTEAVEDAFDDDTDFRLRAFAQRPIRRDAISHLRDQFGRDDAQLLVAHDFLRAVVRGERIVEGDRRRHRTTEARGACRTRSRAFPA